MAAGSEIDTSFKTLDALRHALEKRLNSGSVKLPMMPHIASKVMSLTMDPNADVSDLSNVIHQDPSLAVSVLQVSNSAAYGGGQQIDYLEDAVNRLGMSTLSEITLSTSLQAGVFRAPGLEKEVNRLWRHALASGFYGKEIARLMHGQADSLFLCGLLHAIGKPAVLQLIGDLKQQFEFSVKSEILNTLLDEYHGKIGVTMAEQWDLPKNVQMACCHYLSYKEAPESKDEVAATHLADLLASWLIAPNDVNEEALKQNNVFEVLHFDADGIQSIFESKETVQSRIAAMG